MSREHRRSYFIKRSFQTKLIVRLSLMILVTSLMVALIFIGSRYYVAVQLGDRAHFDVLDEMGTLFFDVLIYWFAGYLVLFAYFALRFSHEIAGPLYRFEKAFAAINEDARLDREVRLRDEDDREYHLLARLYNRALERIRHVIAAVRGLGAELKALERESEPAALSAGIARIRGQLEIALGGLGEQPPADEKQQHLPPAPPPA